MARPYSQDLRKRAIKLITSGMRITQISQLLNISRPTLYKWKENWEINGSISPKRNVRRGRKGKIKDWNSFKHFVDIHGDKTQKEMACLWGNCTRHTISRGLKKIGHTRKKKL